MTMTGSKGETAPAAAGRRRWPWAIAGVVALAAVVAVVVVVSGDRSAADHERAASNAEAALSALAGAQANAQTALDFYVPADLDDPELYDMLAAALEDSHALEPLGDDVATEQLDALAVQATTASTTITDLTDAVEDSSQGETHEASTAALESAIDGAEAALSATAEGHTSDEASRSALATMTTEAQLLIQETYGATGADAMTSDLISLTTTVADSHRPLLADAEGTWCAADPEGAFGPECLTIDLPRVVAGTDPDGESWEYMIGVDTGGTPPDESTDYTEAGFLEPSGCLRSAVDTWPPMSGYAFYYCPAGADLPADDWYLIGTDFPDEDRIFMGQDTVGTPYLRIEVLEELAR